MLEIKMYLVEDLSKYIIDYCHRNNYYLSGYRLQNILYFIQSDFLVKLDRPAFPEKIYASSWGIYIEEVSFHYRVYGNGNIPSWPPYDFDLPFSKKERLHLEKMVDELSKYNSTSLVGIITKQDPWLKNRVFNAKSIKDYREIPNKDLIDFFTD